MKGSGKGGLVTEADVEAAVINAEKKWEKALEVRRQADELSSQAEEAAAQSQTVSQEAAKKIDENTTFSLKMVAQGRKVQNASMKAAYADGHKVQNASMKAAELLAQAADLSQEADLLELEAEGALLDSERAIEQHLVDFPADNQDSQDS